MKRNHDNLSVKHWEKFQFHQPYAKGLKRLKEEVLAKTNFDPATLWQWGTMQAMEFFKNQRPEEEWDVAFETTIPSGSETCFFKINKGSPEESRKWSEFTRMIEEKALDLAQRRVMENKKANDQ